MKFSSSKRIQCEVWRRKEWSSKNISTHADPASAGYMHSQGYHYGQCSPDVPKYNPNINEFVKADKPAMSPHSANLNGNLNYSCNTGGNFTEYSMQNHDFSPNLVKIPSKYLPIFGKRLNKIISWPLPKYDLGKGSLLAQYINFALAFIFKHINLFCCSDWSQVKYWAIYYYNLNIDKDENGMHGNMYHYSQNHNNGIYHPLQAHPPGK